MHSDRFTRSLPPARIKSGSLPKCRAFSPTMVAGFLNQVSMRMRRPLAISCGLKSGGSLAFQLAEFRERFRNEVAEPLAMDWQINDSAIKRRVVVLVSQQEHCLYDLMARWQAKELDVEISSHISNHDTFKGFVEWHGIPSITSRLIKTI